MFLCASVHCGSVYEFVCVFAGVCGHAQWWQGNVSLGMKAGRGPDPQPMEFSPKFLLLCCYGGSQGQTQWLPRGTNEVGQSSVFFGPLHSWAQQLQPPWSQACLVLPCNHPGSVLLNATQGADSSQVILSPEPDSNPKRVPSPNHPRILSTELCPASETPWGELVLICTSTFVSCGDFKWWTIKLGQACVGSHTSVGRTCVGTELNGWAFVCPNMLFLYEEQRGGSRKELD